MPVIWPFRPNWNAPPEITIGYKTDIVTSRSGREQRRALRQQPRKTISYTTLVDSAERQKMLAFLARYQGQQMWAGDPTRKTLTSGTATAGSVSIPPTDWVTLGQQILFEIDGVPAVTGTITSVAGSTVTFSPANADPIAVGAVVRPALLSRVTAAVGLVHPVNRVAQAQVSLVVEPGTEMFPEDVTGIYQLEGREIFHFKPNWVSPVTLTLDWPVEQVDYGIGRVATYQPMTQGNTLISASFLGYTRDRADEIEAFFRRMQGRRGEFFMSSGMDDMQLAGNWLLADASTALLEGGTPLDLFSADLGYGGIEIRLVDGRRLFRSITTAYATGANTTIEVNSPWPEAINRAQITCISWLQVFRFASDDMTWTWRTDQVGEAQIAMQSLEYLAAEGTVDALDGAAQWALEYWGDEAAMNIFASLDRTVNEVYFE